LIWQQWMFVVPVKAMIAVACQRHECALDHSGFLPSTGRPLRQQALNVVRSSSNHGRASPLCSGLVGVSGGPAPGGASEGMHTMLGCSHDSESTVVPVTQSLLHTSCHRLHTHLQFAATDACMPVYLEEY
jgi:hypothetical protein